MPGPGVDAEGAVAQRIHSWCCIPAGDRVDENFELSATAGLDSCKVKSRVRGQKRRRRRSAGIESSMKFLCVSPCL